MRGYKIFCFIMFAFFFLTACSTGFHGSFVPSTYIGTEDSANPGEIGRVMGESCQTRVLYLLPYGPAPSTANAIQSAKDQYEGTKYLTDVSIDERTEWKIGYSRQCVIVEGIAHR